MGEKILCSFYMYRISAFPVFFFWLHSLPLISGRRTPTYFTGNQRDILEAHFEHDNFPEPVEQMAIANQLGVDYAVVKTWFQNTRKNYRKQLKEEGELVKISGI